MSGLRLKLKSASNVPLPGANTHCKLTFRTAGYEESHNTTTVEGSQNPKWDELFEWVLKVKAEDAIEVEIVYESPKEKHTAMAYIRLDSILGKECASKGKDLVVDTTLDEKPLDMKLHVHLAYWAIDYNDLEQDKERLEQENKQLEQDKGQLEQDKERLEQENKLLKQDKERVAQEKERLEQENKQLEQDKGQLEQDKERLEQEKKQLKQDKERVAQDKERLEQENKHINRLRRSQAVVIFIIPVLVGLLIVVSN